MTILNKGYKMYVEDKNKANLCMVVSRDEDTFKFEMYDDLTDETRPLTIEIGKAEFIELIAAMVSKLN